MQTSCNNAAVGVAVEDVQGDGRWQSMHSRFLRDATLGHEILFLGDSLIRNMEETRVWDTLFKPLKAVNFGIGGDCTQHVLWRVESGELDSLQLKVVVLLVGTNNYGNSPEEIVEGIESICWAINSKKPVAKILVLGLLPRGERPNKLRDKHYVINQSLEKILRTIPNTYFLNADPGFVRDDGTIKAEDMFDYLHLTRKGYEEFGTIIYDFLKKYLL